MFLSLIMLGEGGVEGLRGWGCGCRLWPGSSRAVGLRTFAPGYLECCRDRGASSYQPSRVPCQESGAREAREEETHSSNAQWVRACTLVSYLQYVFVCVLWYVNSPGRRSEMLFLKVLFVRKLSNTDTLGWRPFPTYNPKASGFDDLEMRLKNQLFLQIRPFE